MPKAILYISELKAWFCSKRKEEQGRNIPPTRHHHHRWMSIDEHESFCTKCWNWKREEWLSNGTLVKFFRLNSQQYFQRIYHNRTMRGREYDE